MAFLPGFEDIGAGLGSLWSSVTGQTKADQIKNATEAQINLQNQIIAEQQHEADLKYNPVLVAERNKQILIIIGGVIVVIILLKVLKVF